MNAVKCLFSRVAVTAFLALGSGVAGATNVVTDVGALESYANDTYIGLISHVPPSDPRGTAFTDYFNFYTSSSNASSVATTLTLSNILEINGLAVSLYNGTGSGSVGSLVAGPVGSGVTISASLTADAPYTLEVSGTTAGPSGGSYSTAISAVPETNTWTLMLAGLGLVGLRMRRRLDGARGINA
ncbi:MAG: FxDxF family PEP-CTERM protein [Thiobacillaceae bacterium]